MSDNEDLFSGRVLLFKHELATKKGCPASGLVLYKGQ